jgi:hypothetical protein
VFLDTAAQAEKFPVGCGQPLFKIVHGSAPGSAFLAELCGQGVNDAAFGFPVCGLDRQPCSVGGLLRP